MSQSICVYGLGHLGSITAACLAEAGTPVLALDQNIVLPDNEPWLDALFAKGLVDAKITLTHEYAAVATADLIWVTFDTPVDTNDQGHPEWIAARIERIRPYVQKDAVILVSSQVPIGFTRSVQKWWHSDGYFNQFAYAPENLRKGHGVDDFVHPARSIVGLDKHTSKQPFVTLFEPLGWRSVIWMSLEGAEMSKHALNGWLAVTAAYANELGRLSHHLCIDYHEVEMALRSDPRIGTGAYVAAQGPITGGSLLREINVLRMLAKEQSITLPIIESVIESNTIHAYQ